MPETHNQKQSTPKHAPRPGFIGHTELASNDPTATKDWCATVLGWGFAAPVQTPMGDYHTWSFDNSTGGGIRNVNGTEPAGSIPYVESESIQGALDAATKAGATVMVPPTAVPDGSRICVVKAPGGVPIGFWAPN